KSRRRDPWFSASKIWIPGFSSSWPWQNSVTESGDRRKIPDGSPRSNSTLCFSHNSGPSAAAARDPTDWPQSGALEIRLICLWQRQHFVMQEICVVLGADVLLPYTVDALTSLLRIPRRRERARILDVDRDVDRLAAVRQLVALDHVQLFGVGRQVRIDKC